MDSIAKIDQLILRPADALDAAQFVEIMNHQYARKKTPEYFHWQYIDPYEPTVLMCAFHGKELCGMFGLKKRKLNNGIAVGQAIDMLIAPAWRNKGLFKRLVDHAVQYFNKEFDVLCVLANPEGNRAVQRSLSWKNIGIIKTLFLGKAQDISFIEMSQEINENYSDRFYFEKDHGYMNWRFSKNPSYSYDVIYAKGARAWVKIFIDPLTQQKHGDIVDVDIQDLSSASLRGLLCVACERLRAGGVEDVTLWAMPGRPLRTIAESIGFRESVQERFFSVHILNPGCSYLARFDHWDLAEADSEIF